MGNGGIAAVVIWVICALGCGALFFGIGIWADRARKPVHFWSGIAVDSQKIKDIPAYNHANARMWKCYSVPYWLSGILGICAVFFEWLMPVAVIVLVVACFPGIFFLIFHYKRIEKRFIF